MSLAGLALPGVITLISSLAYGSQILLRSMEPHSLEPRQSLTFNGLVFCIWITYARACFTNPGHVPAEWSIYANASDDAKASRKKLRWCKKCDALKPPRAHHCKVCRRCIPKMDHHCPWTINCVSHRTFPHFFRFLVYAVVSMVYLEYILYKRAAVIWADRQLPIYLGPSPSQMSCLFVFIVTNSVTLFILGILLVRNIWCLGANITTIEGWELERHETLVYRARRQGGYLDDPDGRKLWIKRQEFPYDIGIYKNIRQGMGGAPLLWLWPFAATPSNESGLEFEINGFEDPSLSWPPPDPDRMLRSKRQESYPQAFIHDDSAVGQERVDAFHRRQQEDLKRFEKGSFDTILSRLVGTRSDTLDVPSEYPQSNFSDAVNGKEGWRDSEGDRLEDFGVDEEAQTFDEDNVPLVEVIRRRHALETAKPPFNLYSHDS